MASLAGKVALVTGAVQGIGKAICKRLLDEMVKVCLTDINVEKGKYVLNEFREEYGDKSVIFKKLDVTDVKQFENVIIRVKKHFGHLDILMNNAGIGDEVKWKKMMLINVVGVGNGIELAQRHLCNSNGAKGGTVINTASVVGILPHQNASFYSATKCAVIGLTLTMGHKRVVERTKVKVSAICPDLAHTNFYAISRGIIDKEVQPRLEEMILTGELVLATQIAEGAIKLLRDDLTGEGLVISRSKGMYYYPFSTGDLFFELDIL